MGTDSVLRGVPWLATLDAAEVADCASRVAFRAGEELLCELEVGEALYILLEGRARVSVSAGLSDRRDVATIGPGDAVGEISLLTGELHSATVTADTDGAALRIEHADFQRLLARHPEMAIHFARLIATRLDDTDRALDDAGAARALVGQAAAALPAAPSIGRAFRELVVATRRELPFFALCAFIAALVVVRGIADLFSLHGAGLFGFLRSAYTVGIALVFVSTGLSLVRFRGGMQRVLAILYGIGFALILNELSVFLTFDVFYLNMTTPDPRLVFDVELLYRRSESAWAIALMIALLVQLTFLRRFYRRALFVLSRRLRSLLKRTAA